MRDQEGFPLDMAYEMAKEKGWDVDWVEALADAGRQSIHKFDALIEEISMLEPDRLSGIRMSFASGLMASAGDGFHEKAQALYQRMRVGLTSAS